MVNAAEVSIHRSTLVCRYGHPIEDGWFPTPGFVRTEAVLGAVSHACKFRLHAQEHLLHLFRSLALVRVRAQQIWFTLLRHLNSVYPALILSSNPLTHFLVLLGAHVVMVET